MGLSGEKLHVMGASLGTAVALHFAADHPERMASLILCCGPGTISTPLIDEGWRLRNERMQARYRQVGTQESSLPPGLPRVRSPGEKERFAAAYHPYGPVGEAMNLDFPASEAVTGRVRKTGNTEGVGGPPADAMISA